MNKELYKLLCCEREGLRVEYKGQIYDVVGDYSGRWLLDFEGKKYDEIKYEKCKPLLKSVLSYDEELELGLCLIGPSSPKERRWEAEQFLKANRDLSYVADVFTAKSAIEYLYSIHYAFGIDKDLYIENN